MPPAAQRSQSKLTHGTASARAHACPKCLPMQQRPTDKETGNITTFCAPVVEQADPEGGERGDGRAAVGAAHLHVALQAHLRKDRRQVRLPVLQAGVLPCAHAMPDTRQRIALTVVVPFPHQAGMLLSACVKPTGSGNTIGTHLPLTQTGLSVQQPQVQEDGYAQRTMMYGRLHHSQLMNS